MGLSCGAGGARAGLQARSVRPFSVVLCQSGLCGTTCRLLACLPRPGQRAGSTSLCAKAQSTQPSFTCSVAPAGAEHVCSLAHTSMRDTAVT